MLNGKIENDISLLKLNRAVQVSNKAGIVCLPSSKYLSLEEEPITVSGWGRTNDGSGSQSSVLRATELIGAKMVSRNITLFPFINKLNIWYRSLFISKRSWVLIQNMLMHR